MQRGEVWWARLPEPVGRRPVLLLSRNAVYAVRASITVAPITTRIRNIPVEVPLDYSQAVVFFLSFIIVALFMTVRSLETRRWR